MPMTLFEFLLSLPIFGVWQFWRFKTPFKPYVEQEKQKIIIGAKRRWFFDWPINMRPFHMDYLRGYYSEDSFIGTHVPMYAIDIGDAESEEKIIQSVFDVKTKIAAWGDNEDEAARLEAVAKRAIKR